MFSKKILFLMFGITAIAVAQTQTNGWYISQIPAGVTQHWISFSDTFVDPPKSQEFGFIDTANVFIPPVIWEKEYPSTQCPWQIRVYAYQAFNFPPQVSFWLALVHGDTIYWIWNGIALTTWQWSEFSATLSTPQLARFNKIRLGANYLFGQGVDTIRFFVDKIQIRYYGQPWITLDSMHPPAGLTEQENKSLFPCPTIFSNPSCVLPYSSFRIFNVFGQPVEPPLSSGIYFAFPFQFRFQQVQQVKKIIIVQ